MIHECVQLVLGHCLSLNMKYDNNILSTNQSTCKHTHTQSCCNACLQCAAHQYSCPVRAGILDLENKTNFCVIVVLTSFRSRFVSYSLGHFNFISRRSYRAHNTIHRNKKERKKGNPDRFITEIRCVASVRFLLLKYKVTSSMVCVRRAFEIV